MFILNMVVCSLGASVFVLDHTCLTSSAKFIAEHSLDLSMYLKLEITIMHCICQFTPWSTNFLGVWVGGPLVCGPFVILIAFNIVKSDYLFFSNPLIFGATFSNKSKLMFLYISSIFGGMHWTITDSCLQNFPTGVGKPFGYVLIHVEDYWKW